MSVADCLQKLTINPSLYLTVLGFSRRLRKTYNIHRQSVKVIFSDWCEELINNSVKVNEILTKIPIRYNQNFISIRVANIQKREAVKLLNIKILQLESNNLNLVTKLNNTVHELYLSKKKLSYRINKSLVRPHVSNVCCNSKRTITKLNKRILNLKSYYRSSIQIQKHFCAPVR